MSTIIVMPLKMESQRIESKNFCLLGGRPLYRWVLDGLASLIREGIVDEAAVYCTTNVFERVVGGIPPNHREDILNGVRHYQESDGRTKRDSGVFFDAMAHYCEGHTWMIVRNCTSPFLRKSTLVQAVKVLQGQDYYDSSCSVLSLQGRFWRKLGNCANPEFHDPTKCRRTQDQDPLYMESDAFWMFRPRLQRNCGRRIGFHPVFVPLRGIEAIDIDTIEDWQLAEAAAEYIRTRHDW